MTELDLSPFERIIADQVNEIARLTARVNDLLEYNTREVDRRRIAMSALRVVSARIEGTVATLWGARKEDGPEAQYLGTLAEFLRAAIAEGSDG